MTTIQVCKGKQVDLLLREGWVILADIYQLGVWDSVVMGK